VRVGEPAPAFSLPTADGGVLALDELRGRVVLIDFFRHLH
jgi:peroxiredoxin